jgi:hypothetical protein
MPHIDSVVNENFNRQKFIFALEDYCHKNRIDQLEIFNPCLIPEIMKKIKIIRNLWKTYKKIIYL